MVNWHFDDHQLVTDCSMSSWPLHLICHLPSKGLSFTIQGSLTSCHLTVLQGYFICYLALKGLSSCHLHLRGLWSPAIYYSKGLPSPVIYHSRVSHLLFAVQGSLPFPVAYLLRAIRLCLKLKLYTKLKSSLVFVFVVIICAYFMCMYFGHKGLLVFDMTTSTRIGDAYKAGWFASWSTDIYL